MKTCRISNIKEEINLLQNVNLLIIERDEIFSQSLNIFTESFNDIFDYKI